MADQSSSNNTTINPENVIKILMATDIHLGFQHNRNTGTTFEDSFITFEEILQYANEHEVDFILLGGDLFHDAKPSQTTMLRCLELLRKYCLGPREIKIEFLSDPNIVFEHCANKVVNYEDPNFNVSIPVFSIHGNHDDPSLAAVGSLDILSASGLVNYFGKYTNLVNMKIHPLVIKKGETQIAIYGLSHINDKRLARLLNESKIELLSVPDEEFFNILVLHQNRVPHCNYDYIPQTKLPKLLHLVMWGHEHECRIDEEFVPQTKYFITQPGSSIATSLCEGESIPKHVGILKIHGQKFKIEKLPLKTVRPFVFDDLFLQEEEIIPEKNEVTCDAVLRFVKRFIEDKMIPAAARLLTGHPKQPIEPLIRLRVYYETEEQIFDLIKFGQLFCDEVLNPMDMIIFRKPSSSEKKTRNRRPKIIGDPDDPDAGPIESRSENDSFLDMANALGYHDNDDNDEVACIRDIPHKIAQHFNLPSNKMKLKVLSNNGLSEALIRFVEKGDGDAFLDLAKFQKKKAAEYLESCDGDFGEFSNIVEAIHPFIEERDAQDDDNQVKEFFSTRTVKREISDILSDDDILVDTDEDNKSVQKEKEKPKRGRGSRGGRGSRARGTPKLKF
ncbi:double-strand break repair protein MRE11 [Ceratina calcarata]|uniref:Double-strand break repair protein n=1 Tax=Ceratina calcarata TaxID=156304 RepID=A0AAJ7N7P3_9HYME|nr:double-strand break repair protein MRE11 [Ceratina calcarata]XP_026670155.1 double-strand break repair protein MRE11 [Ceratina calcarata]